MDRTYLKGRDGDRINAVLAAAGYDLSLLLRWLEALLSALIALLLGQASIAQILCEFMGRDSSQAPP